MIITCKEATQLASQRLDRKLGFLDRVALRLHLAICKGCTIAAGQMEFLRRAIARLGEEPDKPGAVQR